MSPSIENGHHIHDTLTSGLRLGVTTKTYNKILDKMLLLQKESKLRANEELEYINFNLYSKSYYVTVNIDRHRGHDGVKIGIQELHSWSIRFYRPKDKEHYTSLGLKISRERNKSGSIDYFLTITANPTAIMRNDYAIDVSGVNASNLLICPFEILSKICNGLDTDKTNQDEDKNIFTFNEWDLIDNGNLIMRDIEIAFPLMLDNVEINKEIITPMNKQDLVLNFTRIYGVRMSFKDRVMDLGDVMNCHFQRYPEDSTVSQSTGFRITKKDFHNVHLFSLTMYDKVAEMQAKKKKPSIEDIKRIEDVWTDNLRVDIRVYPAYVKKLMGLTQKESENYTVRISDWLELEKTKPDFCKWLLRKIMNDLEFGFLSSTVREVQEFSKAIEEKFGQATKEKWLESITYTASDLKVNSTEWSRFLTRHYAPTKLGGLLFNMQNAFNFTSVLELKDLKGVFTIDDLSDKIKGKKANSSYDDEKIAFREPLMSFCKYD